MLTKNTFVEIVRTGAANGWCMKPYCTTCAATEFRAALAQLAGPMGGLLCDALCEFEPEDLMECRGWQGALEIAVHDLPVGNSVRVVLDTWLKRVGRHPRFDDLVLYRIVRSLPPNEPLRDAWVRAAIPMAVERRDVSLVETLLLLLGHRAAEYPHLISLAMELSQDSSQVRRVLRNACGIPPSA